MRRGIAFWVIVGAAAGLALAACSGVRSRPEAPSPPSAVAGVSEALTTSFGSTALNSQILSRTTPLTAEADLLIGPGDLIEISIFEVEELSKLKLRIPLRGTITLPLLGPIPAAGRTAIELENEIRARLQQKYIHDPQVSVFVHEHTSQRIAVIGAVRSGGVFTPSGRLRLADGIALAQGLTDEADHVVYLVRRVPAGTVTGSKSAPGSAQPRDSTEEVMVAIDLEALVGGKEDLNVPLQAGDVINVPRAGSYYVGGAVERPGSYLLKSITTVEQAILAAGGAKDVADWEDIRLYRGRAGANRQIVTFSLHDFQNGQTVPEVQKGDVIIVGKSGGKAFWYGFIDFFKGIFGLSKGL